jgi:hypothetical protein
VLISSDSAQADDDRDVPAPSGFANGGQKIIHLLDLHRLAKLSIGVERLNDKRCRKESQSYNELAA